MSMGKEFGSEDAPNIGVGEFYGLRKWMVDPNLYNLHAITYSEYAWTPGKNESKHIYGGMSCACSMCIKARQWYHQNPIQHENINHVPTVNCTCGFYAYFHNRGNFPSANYGTIDGVIKAWGKMVIGPLGFRAQYAEIVALCISEDAYNTIVVPGHPAGIRNLERQQGSTLSKIYDKYQVPIFKNRRSMLDRFPLSENPIRLDIPF